MSVVIHQIAWKEKRLCGIIFCSLQHLHLKVMSWESGSILNSVICGPSSSHAKSAEEKLDFNYCH